MYSTHMHSSHSLIHIYTYIYTSTTLCYWWHFALRVGTRQHLPSKWHHYKSSIQLQCVKRNNTKPLEQGVHRFFHPLRAGHTHCGFNDLIPGRNILFLHGRTHSLTDNTVLSSLFSSSFPRWRSQLPLMLYRSVSSPAHIVASGSGALHSAALCPYLLQRKHLNLNFLCLFSGGSRSETDCLPRRPFA